MAYAGDAHPAAGCPAARCPASGAAAAGCPGARRCTGPGWQQPPRPGCCQPAQRGSGPQPDAEPNAEPNAGPNAGPNSYPGSFPSAVPTAVEGMPLTAYPQPCPAGHLVWLDLRAALDSDGQPATVLDVAPLAAHSRCQPYPLPLASRAERAIQRALEEASHEPY